jgi:protoheme IX farnesyltransferase
MWTPPHFWALALFKMRDYGSVGIPMMPNVVGQRSTKIQMVVYSVLMAAVVAAPTVTGLASVGYGVFTGILSLIFICYSILVLRMAEDDEKMLPAKKLFFYSIFYLFAVFSALIFDHMVAGLSQFLGGLL